MSALLAHPEPSSFRDPAGFVFRDPQGSLLRQVNRAGAADFSAFVSSGLYAALAKRGWLIEHEHVPLSRAATDDAAAVLQPRPLDFISYPYEWAFSALKAAALLTLDIQQSALQHAMTLKDASAFNVQFLGSVPVFIDTLSFERYSPGSPWAAYGQFCRHFVAPLALMAHADLRLGRLSSLHLDGVPLDLAAKLLPLKARFDVRLLMHVFLQARMIHRHADARQAKHAARHVTPTGLAALLGSLRALVERLELPARQSEWSNYYADNSYTPAEFQAKQRLVRAMLGDLSPQHVWDLGANTGVFSRIAAECGAQVCAFDNDPACVDAHFRRCVAETCAAEARSAATRTDILPLVMDLTNPSPALGWALRERQALLDRGPCDVALALALVHHLAIANNVPLPKVADLMANIARHLVIEFVPKSDPQIQRMLHSRRDIFHNYSQPAFEAAFERRFTLLERHELSENGRVLYLMARRGEPAQSEAASAAIPAAFSRAAGQPADSAWLVRVPSTCSVNDRDNALRE